MNRHADRTMNAWRSNAWLGVLGAASLACLFALGYDGFSDLVRKHYWAFHDSFRLRDSIQVTWAYRLSRLAAVGALGGYATASWAGIDVFAWLRGPHDDPDARWRSILVTGAIVGGVGFLFSRIARDVDVWRTQIDFSLPYAQYSGRFYDGNVNEHDFFTVRRFGEDHHGAALAILRGVDMYETPTSPWRGHLRIDHLHVSRNLFPDVRVYLVHARACDPDDVPADWFADRGITWMIRDCDDEFRFAPERMGRWPARGAD